MALGLDSLAVPHLHTDFESCYPFGVDEGCYGLAVQTARCCKPWAVGLLLQHGC